MCSGEIWKLDIPTALYPAISNVIDMSDLQISMHYRQRLTVGTEWRQVQLHRFADVFRAGNHYDGRARFSCLHALPSADCVSTEVVVFATVTPLKGARCGKIKALCGRRPGSGLSQALKG